MRNTLVEGTWRVVSVLAGAGVCVGLAIGCASPEQTQDVTEVEVGISRAEEVISTDLGELLGAHEIEADDGEFNDGLVSTQENSEGDISVECTGTLPGTWDHCSVECPCDDGGGDCDGDDECVSGGRCMRDVGPAYGWASDMDVCEVGCVPAEAGYLGTLDFCSEECPCDSGQGDCDSTSECGEGLVCGFDLGASFGFDADTDVCISPSDPLMNGHYQHCSVEFPCPTGHGDCDSDEECGEGLECGFDLGASFGFDPETDVCLSPLDDLMNGHPDHCTAASPCAAGHGDCDGDSQCVAGTTCVNDVGANYGFAANIDVCETTP